MLGDGSSTLGCTKNLQQLSFHRAGAEPAVPAPVLEIGFAEAQQLVFVSTADVDLADYGTACFRVFNLHPVSGWRWRSADPQLVGDDHARPATVQIVQQMSFDVVSGRDVDYRTFAVGPHGAEGVEQEQ